ncbi:MAG TPA: diguanylate cyclase [Azospira sp.]|nr:diguanylate cyclase [Azospira sp.]
MASILISDDRPQKRRYLATLLGHAGHRVLEAGSGTEALAITHSAHPDLVLINVMMPPPGGYRFLRQLSLEIGQSLPRVIFLATPYMESEARLLAQAYGVARVIADNAEGETLLLSIDAALAEPPPGLEAVLAEEADGDALYPLVSQLYGRVTEQESLNVRLERRVAVGNALLEVARAALGREVGKRLWTEQEMAQENLLLRRQSVRDSLTGLYNRRYLEESLAREESRAHRCGRPLGVMMIDIDHFKRCNDSFGHAAGDAALRALSRYMASLARTEDILCRYGGEEFALVMTNTDQEMLRQRAEALRTGVPQLRIVHDDKQIGPLTLSIGLAVFPNDGPSAAAVLQAADAALADAKIAGGDCIASCSIGAHKATA